MKEWEIQERTNACYGCQKEFKNADEFQCLLILPETLDADIIRRDFCVSCWSQFPSDNGQYLFWRGKVKIDEVPEKPKPVKDELVAPVLKSLLSSDNVLHRKSCYVLLVMLERKKIMFHRDTFQQNEKYYLVYENIRTGESIVIEDPQIHLSDIEKLQQEVKPVLDEEFAKVEAAWLQQSSEHS
ncbi:MAG: hypothetical protein Q8Q33_04645 [Chlamydiota bacterium]|nr:hypothetical protein [Chlamydiota bacterium]